MKREEIIQAIAEDKMMPFIQPGQLAQIVDFVIENYQQPMPNSTQLIELWHEDKEMLKEKDFRGDQWRLAYNAFMCGFGRGIAVKKQEQPNNMIQWTGSNLQEVIDFTGKSPKFGEWFKSWEDFENYVHSHGDIFKLFCEDGSHYEVPVGAWIVKTPDGYNLPSVAKYIQHEQPKVDLMKEMEEYFGENWKDGTSIEVQDDMIKFARHFWNKGFNARMEE